MIEEVPSTAWRYACVERGMCGDPLVSHPDLGLRYVRAGGLCECHAPQQEGLGTNPVSVFYHTSEPDHGAPMHTVDQRDAIGGDERHANFYRDGTALRGQEWTQTRRPAAAVKQS